MAGLTVGELRAMLTGLPDDMPIVVRSEDKDGNSFCGGIIAAAVEDGCASYEGPTFFALDCSDDEEAFDEDES